MTLSDYPIGAIVELTQEYSDIELGQTGVIVEITDWPSYPIMVHLTGHDKPYPFAPTEIRVVYSAI